MKRQEAEKEWGLGSGRWWEKLFHSSSHNSAYYIPPHEPFYLPPDKPYTTAQVHSWHVSSLFIWKSGHFKFSTALLSLQTPFLSANSLLLLPPHTSGKIINFLLGDVKMLFLNLYILIVYPLLLMQLLKEEFTLCFKLRWKETEKKFQIDLISFFVYLYLWTEAANSKN